jgi:bis(5'-nucleosyl)-tetraphosphatase (symmetrical)
MSTYAVGDLQGCFGAFCQLLEKLQFNPQNDHLWLVGDLVNRGPQSLEVLRFASNPKNRVRAVLGNHDLHLLAVAYGNRSYHVRKDTLDHLLNAPDAEYLLHWLRHQPLLHHDSSLRTTMVHAGLAPDWSLLQATHYAEEVETRLQGTDFKSYLSQMYGNVPDCWSDNLQGMDRLRYLTNVFTRLRYCNTHGQLLLDDKGTPGTQPDGFLPWFQHLQQWPNNQYLLFGHWSTLGSTTTPSHIQALDSGCLWGGELTAWCLDKKQRISIDCEAEQNPQDYSS